MQSAYWYGAVPLAPMVVARIVYGRSRNHCRSSRLGAGHLDKLGLPASHCSPAASCAPLTKSRSFLTAVASVGLGAAACRRNDRR